MCDWDNDESVVAYWWGTGDGDGWMHAGRDVSWREAAELEEAGCRVAYVSAGEGVRVDVSVVGVSRLPGVRVDDETVLGVLREIREADAAGPEELSDLFARSPWPVVDVVSSDRMQVDGYRVVLVDGTVVEYRASGWAATRWDGSTVG